MKSESAVHPLRMRRFEGSAKDPYVVRRKLASPTVCPECGAVYESGRWTWHRPAQAPARQHLCQACRRIKESYPAGWVLLKGDFVRTHRQEIIDLAHAEERQENQEHPLNRIMRIEDQPGGLVITTTDVHLPRLIGEALRRAHQGELRVRYDVNSYAVRVEWRRREP